MWYFLFIVTPQRATKACSMYLFSAYFKLNKRFEFNPVYPDYFILFTAVTLLFDRAAEQTNRNGMKVTV